MNRRGFMSKLGSFFNRPGDTFFFGIQAVVNIFGEDETRSGLHRIIGEGGEMERPSDKRAFYKRIVALLIQNQPFIEYGHWDYVTNSDDAHAEFQTWVTEIEASIATEEEELGGEIDEMHRLSSDKSYVIVTMLFLMERVPANKSFVEAIEAHVDDEFLERAAILELIESINYADFEYSIGDAAFVMPGNHMDGISWEDIHGEGWSYLKPVM